MITGAEGSLGRAVATALLDRNPEVRAAVASTDEAESLRALGAKVTLGRLDEAPALAAVLKGVHTVVHLAGGVGAVDEEGLFAANHRSTMVALGAARSAGVTRFVLLSYPGASPDASHPYLRAKGIAEEAVLHSGLEHAILRCAHMIGAGEFWFTCAVEAASSSPPFVVEPGTRSLAPVGVDDVAEVVASIDDRREPVEGIWGLEGCDVLDALELSELLGGSDPEVLSSMEAAARLSASLGVPVGRAAAELFAMPSRSDAPDAAAEFGVERTGLVDAIHRVGAALGLEG
jgi:uncharacterized protein YbjT (DUF2867 family)